MLYIERGVLLKIDAAALISLEQAKQELNRQPRARQPRGPKEQQIDDDSSAIKNYS